MKDPILITGHRNPDSDSIVATLAYAELKKQLGFNVLPIRLGNINAETSYILNRFNIEPPRLMPKLEMEIKDITIDEPLTVHMNATIKEAWDLMSHQNRKAIAIVDDHEHLLGITTLGKITETLLSLINNDFELIANTPYKNIADVIWGNVLIEPKDYNPSGFISISSGVLVEKKEIGFKNKIVLVSTREHSQIKAIETGASLIVVCFAKKEQITEEVQKLAIENGCGIIYTTLDMFSTSQSITQAIPINLIMTTELVSFHESDILNDVKNTINKSRFRTYPVVDNTNQLTGFLSRYHLWNHERTKIILVDHNEEGQSIEGLDEAEVIEIIDHHRLGNIQTNSPVMFRNEIIGSTSSIITKMYREHDIKPSKEIAGILLGAVISDTMNFASPTCTAQDVEIGKELAKLSGVDIEEYAREIFNASATLTNKSIEEIVLTDFKDFDIEGYGVAISHINVVDSDKVFEMKDALHEFMTQLCIDRDYDMALAMITDINDKGSYLITAGPEDEILEKAFEEDKQDVEDIFFVPGVLSRKKQVIPSIAAAITRMNIRS